MHFAIYRATRRALERDQRRPQPGQLPLWRLLLGEIVLLIKRVGRWRFTVAALAAFGAFLFVEVALSSKTPGPALAEPWRWLAAACLTLVTVLGWAIMHAMRRTSPTAEEA